MKKNVLRAIWEWFTEAITDWFLAIAKRILGPCGPGPITKVVVKEIPGMGYKHTVTIPALTEEPTTEVLRRKLIRVVGAAEAVEADVPVSTEETTFEFTAGAFGDHVTLTLVNVDKGGNETPGPAYEYDINADDNPPAAPGAVSATVVEVPDA